jgi:hypothetical protein
MSTLFSSPHELNRLKAQYGDNLRVAWEPTPFQTNVLLRLEKEIGLFGGKFSGKSEVARMFLVKGNPDLPDSDPDGNPLWINRSYVYHPNYYATVLRRNQVDLDEFLSKAKLRYEPFRGEWKNGRFEFPSGAKINCGHLADRDSWMKYIGIENVRFVIEEAALIPDFGLYEQIKSCCRSVWPEMRPQILLTSNFGGPGTYWILEQFIDAADEDGNIYPPGTPIHTKVEDPIHPGQYLTDTKIWMFSTMRDNPYAENDPSYRATMASLTDEKLRRAYIEGDWRALTGPYFDQFRPKGPIGNEPPQARHVYPAGHEALPRRQSWYHQWGSIDVGHRHQTAVHWYYYTPQGQTVVEEEFGASGTSYVQIGLEIGRRTLQRLKDSPNKGFVFYISHDAFASRTEDRSIVELIAAGVAKVLGPKMVNIPDLEVSQLLAAALDERAPEVQKAIEEIKKIKSYGITFIRAPKDRVIGWQHCREGLRFYPVGQAPPAYDPTVARALLHISTAKWEAYEELYKKYKPEVLPKVLIVGPAKDPKGKDVPGTGCPQLIAAIPKARHYPPDQPGKDPEDVDKTHFVGMDFLDGWRYGMMGKLEVVPEEPYNSMRDRVLAQALQATPEMETNDKIWLNMMLEAREARGLRGKFTQPLIIPRKSRGRRYQKWLQDRKEAEVDLWNL